MKVTRLNNVLILNGMPFMLLPYYDDDFWYWGLAPLGVVQAEIES